MSAYALDPNTSADIMDHARMNPMQPMDLSPAWYAGAWKTPVTGLASAVNDAALLLGDAATPVLRSSIGQPIDKMFGTHVDEWLVSEQQKQHDNIKNWAPDPRTTGVLGNAVHGLFNIVPEVMLGGPETAGILQGYKGFKGGQQDGLDTNTAFGKGVIDGVTAWAGVKIPLTLAPKLGAAANVAASGAANVGFGMASRGVTSEYLRQNGYADMADQYKILDQSAMVVDLIIGGGFGALVHYGPTGRALRNEVMADRVRPSDVDAALTLNEQLHIELDTAPGIPVDVATRAAHVESMNGALESLLLGEPVHVDAAVTRGEFIENPTAAETRVQVRDAVADHMGPEWKVFEAELRARGLPLDDIDQSAVVRFEPQPRAPETAPDAAPKTQDDRKTIKNKAGEIFIDTRGGTDRFHGTSRELAGLSDEYAMSGDNRNIYGQGFYTTDAADISHGYMRKGRNGSPSLYKVNERGAPKLFDMEAPMSPEFKNMAKTVFGDLYTESNLDGKPVKSARELYDEVRAESKNEGLTRDEVQEMFDSVRYNLEKQGYHGFSHLGGTATGHTPHSVKIFWTPEAHIEVVKSDIGGYQRDVENSGPAPAQKSYNEMNHLERAKAREQKLAAQLETANRNAANRAAARNAAEDGGPTAPHQVATHADHVDVAPIMAEHTDMEIPAGDGKPLQAADVLAQSDAEIASAKQDSQGFDAAITCLLRN